MTSSDTSVGIISHSLTIRYPQSAPKVTKFNKRNVRGQRAFQKNKTLPTLVQNGKSRVHPAVGHDLKFFRRRDSGWDSRCILAVRALRFELTNLQYLAKPFFHLGGSGRISTKALQSILVAEAPVASWRGIAIRRGVALSRVGRVTIGKSLLYWRC